MLLTDFEIIRPEFETSQAESFHWLVEAHTKAEGKEGFRETIKEKLWHVGCKPDYIGKRGYVLADYNHLDWEKMEVYRLHESPAGKDLSTRAKVYAREVDKVFEKYYSAESLAPDDMIHVSCTGYVSPSGAQKIVSKRGWGEATTVTHAYHMGCYGSFPAIRIGTGFLHSAREKQRVDIVHTEICSLHTNPSMHQLDQLVSQSLFADGFIKYSAVREADRPHLKILSLQEEIIPHSTKAMTWDVVEWGFQMSLAKEVAVLITRHLPGYLERLYRKTGPLSSPLFAIHPGGPKILTHVQSLLGLSDMQMKQSFQTLKAYGNMSSATIPHIWQAILSDENVPNHTPIVSLAFGPGLSISGAILEKICGC
ncbi:MAG TPA: 3-oxoacyl-[acyl-carrier-protein] synthase III C-terminal domain-containing protein [Chlamydiales bacterium]|nr:3-oxoacyl-[acyl-carrier-protein] synthase III C-terminal domain-containing protein [Chlamydiales bacterium]